MCFLLLGQCSVAFHTPWPSLTTCVSFFFLKCLLLLLQSEVAPCLWTFMVPTVMGGPGPLVLLYIQCCAVGLPWPLLSWHNTAIFFMLFLRMFSPRFSRWCVLLILVTIVYNWGTFLMFSCCFLSSLQICVFDLWVRGNTLPTVVHILTMWILLAVYLGATLSKWPSCFR